MLPGAIDVAAANMLPLAGEGGNSALSIPGTSVPLFEHALGNIRTVNSDYFRTMSMSLQAGRLFSDADRERQVAVISMSIAKRAWPGEDQVGKRFHFCVPLPRASLRPCRSRSAQARRYARYFLVSVRRILRRLPEPASLSLRQQCWRPICLRDAQRTSIRFTRYATSERWRARGERSHAPLSKY